MIVSNGNGNRAYGFTEKLAEGEQGEAFIASCLSVLGRIHIVSSMGYQRIGIDAFIASERYGYTSIQFKRCSQAARYGNAFIEIRILDEHKKEKDIGWAYKTTANNIAYWAVGTGRIYVMDTMAVKRQLPSWKEQFRIGQGCSNENGRTWYAEGLCVPLSVIQRQVCTDVLTVNEENL